MESTPDTKPVQEHFAKYRADIDGLRGIAVLSVIFFHAKFPWCPAGFLGVDIFYVISGYLISTIAYNQMENKSFSLIRFYERRALRILPALFIMLIFSTIAACIILIWTEIIEYSKSMLFTLIFISNFLFYTESGYFDTSNDFTPLLHTWSLGIEEQYYFHFPFMFLFINSYLAKNPQLISMCVIFSLSIISSIFFDWIEPEFGFYSLLTREWEFLAGVIVAFLHQRVTFAEQQTLMNFQFQIIGNIGIIGIFASVLYFNNIMGYQTIIRLISVICAALVIYDSSGKYALKKLLSCNVLVFTGKISYSLYLYHQPVFVFYRIWKLKNLNEMESWILIAFCLLIAIFSWKLVEEPFRRGKGFRLFKISILITLFIILLLTSFALLHFQFYNEKDKIDQFMLTRIKENSARNKTPIAYLCQNNQSSEKFKSSCTIAGKVECLSHLIAGSYLDLNQTIRININNLEIKISRIQHCGNSQNAKYACKIGNNDVDPTWAIIGDSIAYSLAVGFEKILINLNQSALLYARQGCPTFKNYEKRRNVIVSIIER